MPTSLAEPIFVGTLFAPTWSMKTKPRGNNSRRILRRLNLINLGEVALSWKQIWGVPFLVINWFPLWLYYRTASGDSAHCYHIYPFLVVNGLNAQVQSCAWSLLFFLFGTITYFVWLRKRFFARPAFEWKIRGFYLIVAYLICHECSYFLYNVCGSTCTWMWNSNAVWLTRKRTQCI